MKIKSNKCQRCGERYDGPSFWFAPFLGADKTLSYCSEECREAAMQSYRAKARRDA